MWPWDGAAGAIRIYGDDYPTPDGTCIRDYIHVADLADAHLLAFDALATQDRLIYNLGNGTGFSVREVIESARRVTGHPIPAVVPFPSRRAIRPCWWPAPEKAIRELGWSRSPRNWTKSSGRPGCGIRCGMPNSGV